MVWVCQEVDKCRSVAFITVAEILNHFLEFTDHIRSVWICKLSIIVQTFLDYLTLSMLSRVFGTSRWLNRLKALGTVIIAIGILVCWGTTVGNHYSSLSCYFSPLDFFITEFACTYILYHMFHVLADHFEALNGLQVGNPWIRSPSSNKF